VADITKDPNKLERMSQGAKSLGVTDSVTVIGDIIASLIN
jgi:UDP-N-acetylglucosamine:LPS N-acetylglucosamine transferase